MEYKTTINQKKNQKKKLEKKIRKKLKKIFLENQKLYWIQKKIYKIILISVNNIDNGIDKNISDFDTI